VLHYHQHCPVARALEVVGERWSLLIVRELLLGPCTAAELRNAFPRASRSTLTTRVNGLVKAGIVMIDDEERYHLSDEGVALAPVVVELARWAADAGAARLGEEHFDVDVLAWEIQRRIDTGALPWRRTIVDIEFVDRPPASRHLWLMLSRSEVVVGRQQPEGPVEARLLVPSDDFVRWWVGELEWLQLLGRPGVRANHAARRALPAWLARSAFMPQALYAPEHTA
jgi:DNA-binding HxlR family transcriptional regulator